jgi:hypothetical protein
VTRLNQRFMGRVWKGRIESNLSLGHQQKSGVLIDEIMDTILTDVAILLVVATVWNYLQQEERLTPARKTWLSVAGLFALISALLQLFRR